MALIADALIAGVILIDRGWTAAENVLRFRLTPPEAVDGAAQPAGAGLASACPGTGGHPCRSTSELLKDANAQLAWAFIDGTAEPAVIRVLRGELRDRAAQFAAIGD